MESRLNPVVPSGEILEVFVLFYNFLILSFLLMSSMLKCNEFSDVSKFLNPGSSYCEVTRDFLYYFPTS